MRPLLRRLGIDPEQFRALLSASLLMDFRGPALGRRARGGGGAASPLIRGLFLQMGFATLLALGALRSRLALELLGLAYSTMVCASAMLADYASQLLLPDDADILGHRPITPRTLFAARAANVCFYLLLMGASLNLPPAFLGIAAGGPAFPLVFLPIAFLADFVVAAAVLALQGLLLHRLDREKFQDVIAYVQGALMLLVFVSYQLVPGLARPLVGAGGDAPRWTLALPPGWFAGLCELLLGQRGPVTLGLALLGAASTLLLVPLGLRRLVALYGREPLRVQSRAPAQPATAAAGWTRRRPLLARLGTLGLRGPARAAFDLAWAQMARDRALKIGVYPALVIPVAMLVGIRAQGTGRVDDPFEPGTAPVFFATYVGVTMVALLPRYLKYSPSAEAAWILRAAPVERPHELWRGARRAMAARLGVPTMALLTLLLCRFAPPLHALAHMAVATAAGLFVAALANLGLRDLPFSLPRQRGPGGGRLFGTIFGAYLLVGSLGLVHAQLAWHAGAASLGAYAAALAALAIGLFRLGDRRLGRRFEDEL